MNKEIKQIVIAGGGTAGWIAAAALSKKLPGLVEVTLVESEDIGTVGVGEATIPPMQLFHSLLGIDEQAFMRATEATFKLGISFENWGQVGDKYFHPFGTTGKGSFLAEFQHFWLHGLTRGIKEKYGEYCYEVQAAQGNKFAKSANSSINYAYHLDATLYARFLRTFCENLGVKRIEGRIKEVIQHQHNGYIASLRLESGQLIEGDFFIDCTGFYGLLIEQTLKTGYQSWEHWLPCNSAVAVQTESTEVMPPYTRSIAHDSGWQWRIPLQHRVGNGLVYCSQYLSDEAATDRLLQNLDAKTINEPRVLKYKTGRRNKFWNKNCLALGLSSGFVEPLESTSIYMFMNGIVRFLRLFPFDGVSQAKIDEYNQQSISEAEKIRDFIILHYHVTEREDSPFWRYCKNMQIPDSLSHRIELFKENAHAFQTGEELFRLESWTHVMLGQRLMPDSYHKIISTIPDKELKAHLANIRNTISNAVSKLPDHGAFIQRYCKAGD